MSFWDKMTEPRPLNTNFGKEPKVVVEKPDYLESKLAKLKIENSRLRAENIRLKNMLPHINFEGQTLDEIMTEVSSYTKEDIEDIKAPSRLRKLVRARAIFIALARRNNHTFEAIGRYLNRDHSTIMSSHRDWRSQVYDEDVKYLTNE